MIPSWGFLLAARRDRRRPDLRRHRGRPRVHVGGAVGRLPDAGRRLDPLCHRAADRRRGAEQAHGPARVRPAHRAARGICNRRDRDRGRGVATRVGGAVVRVTDRRMDTYDVVVIGAGSTGENVAGRTGRARAARRDRRVGARRRRVLLLRVHAEQGAAAPRRRALRRARVAGAREAVTGALDAQAVLARRDSFTSDWHDDWQARGSADKAVDLVRGRARIAGAPRGRRCRTGRRRHSAHDSRRNTRSSSRPAANRRSRDARPA